MESYGQLVAIETEKMCVQIDGSGDKTIVLLHGAGIAAPILELRPLAALLSKNFKVVTLEYFGYGLSDNSKKERTIEAITGEIHSVLQQLELGKFILMAHSVSGVYGLYYANQHPECVEAFVGIDTSVPRQNEFFNTEKLNILLFHLQRFLARTGGLALLSKIKPSLLVPEVKNYSRPPEEAELIRTLSLKNSTNSNLLDELKNGVLNFKKAEGMKLPPIPALFFLASETIKVIKPWCELHKELVDADSECKIVVLDGSHFLYNQYSQEIADTTFEFIAGCIF